MKVLVLLAVIALVAGAPNPNPNPQQSKPNTAADVQVVRSESENDGAGNFKWDFETSDGAKQEQSGFIKNPDETDPEKRIQVIQGKFTFLDTETGKPITVSYIADENGYQPLR